MLLVAVSPIQILDSFIDAGDGDGRVAQERIEIRLRGDKVARAQTEATWSGYLIELSNEIIIIMLLVGLFVVITAGTYYKLLVHFWALFRNNNKQNEKYVFYTLLTQLCRNNI